MPVKIMFLVHLFMHLENIVVLEKIKVVREKKGMSQADLAHEIGVDQSTICRIEAGNQRIYLDTLVAIADALEVKPAKLLTEAA